MSPAELTPSSANKNVEVSKIVISLSKIFAVAIKHRIGYNAF
jgi:hypothetical protein